VKWLGANNGAGKPQYKLFSACALKYRKKVKKNPPVPGVSDCLNRSKHIFLN